jgi:hypothetical protein
MGWGPSPWHWSGDQLIFDNNFNFIDGLLLPWGSRDYLLHSLDLCVEISGYQESFFTAQGSERNRCSYR